MTSSSKRQFGNIGERVACAFLEKRGFKILERNYLRKWGELDIIAEKTSDEPKRLAGKPARGQVERGAERGGRVVHFVEVKSMAIDSSIRAEENMHLGKLKRLHRAIETYLLERKIDSDWQLDLVIVKIDTEKRKAVAEIIENVC